MLDFGFAKSNFFAFFGNFVCVFKNLIDELRTCRFSRDLSSRNKLVNLRKTVIISSNLSEAI